MIYRFRFWDTVYYMHHDSSFPSHSREARGQFVGFAEEVGHPMTYKILADKTGKLLYRSRVRSAEAQGNPRVDASTDGEEKELPEESPGGRGGQKISRTFQESDDNSNHTGRERQQIGKNEDDSVYGESENSSNIAFGDKTWQRKDKESATEQQGNDDSDKNILPDIRIQSGPTISIEDIIGKTYLTNPNDNGERERMYIVEAVEEHDDSIANNPLMTRFKASNADETIEEIITYNQVMDKLETTDGEDDLWKFQEIQDHQGPLSASHSDYKGSRWNVKILWDNGKVSWEPLSTTAKSDPVTCAIYAEKNGLLNTSGWRRFRGLARKQRRLIRQANKTKIRTNRRIINTKFGIEVPSSYHHARELDRKNGNKFWSEAEDKEFGQLDKYFTFKDIGKDAKPPPGYKKIRVHLVYDVKHDLRRKARVVAGGHLTGIPTENVYSSVVSLRGLRIVVFLAELNGLLVWSTDVGNAYLEAWTKEKVYIIAGPEFGSREGHTLLIQKALYGLKSSGKRWHERCLEILIEMGFVPMLAQDDICIRKKDDHYEYLVRYVDDLAIASKDPGAIIKELTDRYKLKLKGSGPIKYHLGCDFYREENGTLCMAPKKYIERLVGNYKSMFGVKPKHNVSSPLERNDHPELDTSEELDADGIRIYQSMIGSLQWVVSIGRLDIATAVMTLSKFRSAPRIGHLERAKRIFSYISKMRHAVIRYRVEKPDYSNLPETEYEWEKSVYGNVHEDIPDNIPKPLGKPVIHTTYVDANLMHDVTSGKSATGILHLLNKTPIDWFTKKQPTVETATYGSEFRAARIATEQILDLRTTLRYLGVPVEGPTILFGDNESVVRSSMIPEGRLHKRHLLLSFHRVRECIAGKIVKFIYIPGDMNPADILSKAWGYQQVWHLLKALLFWSGNTLDLMSEELKRSCEHLYPDHGE